MARPEPTIQLEKAHDVRQLRGCAHCGKIGDRRFMVVAAERLMHASCALECLGIEDFLRLPRDELGKVSLGEVGPTVMRRICDTCQAHQ